MSLRFSQDIKILLEKLASKPLTIGEILQETQERGFSLIISLLILPFLVPMPPGLAGVMGVATCYLGIQMALGCKYPRLPKPIAQVKFPQGLSRKLLKNIRRLLIWLEKIVRPRWQKVANNYLIWRINGLCIAWLSILLMLPIPLTNSLLGVNILIISVATLESDGLLICLGHFLTFLNTLLFGFIAYALWQAPHLLPSYLSPEFF